VKVTREDTSPLDVTLNIQLDPTDIEPYLERSYRRVVRRVRIPGFRPGKAPRRIVENHLGRDALVRESLDLIVQETLDKAIQQERLATFGEPDLQLLETEPLSFKAVVPLEPTVRLGDFRSIQAQPEAVQVSDSDVDLALERMRYDAAPWQPVERAVRFGDLLDLDVEGTIEGKRALSDKGVQFLPQQHYPFPFPGFSEHLEGLEKGVLKEFTLLIPDDYRDRSMAGKECQFTVRVRELKEKALPDLDDEFAKGVEQGYESLDVLRAKVRGELAERAERSAERDLQEKLLGELIEGSKVEASELTIERETEHLLEERAQALRGRSSDVETYLQDAGKTREELKAELKPVAVERLTRYLVVRKLAQDETLEVGPEEVEAEIDDLVSAAGESQDALRRGFSTENARSSIRNAILTRKVLARLAAIARGSPVGSVATPGGGESASPGPSEGPDDSG
jgi:trigger factor